jgi:hypothetical protein
MTVAFAIERMQGTADSATHGVHLIDGADHWVQQKKPGDVNRLLLGFLEGERK